MQSVTTPLEKTVVNSDEIGQLATKPRATPLRRINFPLVGKSSIYRESIISHVPPPKRHPYDQWSPDARALDLVGDKWTLLIVRDLASGPRRFVELQRVLPGISTEQLRSRLNRMVADGMLTRKRYREVPPRVDYELTDRARDLMPVLAALARWGYDWAWSEPRGSEAVDIGAIFRLAPGLIPASEPARTVEFVGHRSRHRLRDHDHVATASRSPSARPTPRSRVRAPRSPDGSPRCRRRTTARAWRSPATPRLVGQRARCARAPRPPRPPRATAPQPDRPRFPRATAPQPDRPRSRARPRAA